MPPLRRVAFRATAGAAVAIGVLAGSAALVRILPWLFDPRIPWRAAGVFARGLVAAGGEVTGMVALPFGYALAAALFTDRGEARACFLAGASPSTLARSTSTIVIAGALLTAACSALVARDATSPAAVLGEMSAASRAGCQEAVRPVAEIPGTGAAWLCAGGEKPTLAVLLGTAGVIRTEDVSFSPSLDSVTLLAARFDVAGPPRLRVQVDQASVRGITLPGASGLGAVPRAVAVGLSSALGALATMTVLLHLRVTRRVGAIGLGVLTAAGCLLGLRALEGAAAGWWAVPALSILALAPSSLAWSFRTRVAARSSG